MLTEELVMRFAYLTGYEKELLTRACISAMAMGYEAFPSDDTLEAICRYIMLGNPREPEYFRWFALAVEQRTPPDQTCMNIMWRRWILPIRESCQSLC